MANLRAAIEHAGTALLSVGTGLPVGDLVNLTRALFGQHGPASVKSLARSVERDLTGWIDTEYGGAAAIEPALATLDDLLKHHALGLRAVVEQHGMSEASVAAAIMAGSERFLAGLNRADRSLVEQLIERIYRRYLDQPELLHELSGVALRYLLEQQALNREEFERVWRALEGLRIPKPPPFSIPQPVGDFKGYEAEIAAVQAALAEGSASISAVQGIGGVGKTELARAVARRMRGDFPDGQILVDMLGTTQPRGARDAMTDVLVALGFEDIRPDTLAAEYQSRVAGKRVLILLDNVAERAGLDQLVPPEPAALLVTSRTRLALPGVVPVELEKLSRDAAKALVAGIVPGLTDEQADALAGLCADLPLALRVAGAYLQATGYAVGAYLDELRERRLARLAESGEDIGDATLNPAVVLGHSYDRLAESNAELARLYTLLGVFPADFEAAGAAAVLGLDEPGARRQLGRLVQRGLVQPPEQGRWRLHDLLRELAESLAISEDKKNAISRHGKWFTAIIEKCEHEILKSYELKNALQIFAAERLNFAAALLWLEVQPDQQEFALALHSMAVFEGYSGRRAQALEFQERSVDVYRNLEHHQPGKWRLGIANALTNYSTALRENGRVSQAIPLLFEALGYFSADDRNPRDVLQPLIARCHSHLANAYAEMQQPREALPHALKTAMLRKQIHRDKPCLDTLPDFCASYLGLASRLHSLGRSACGLRFGEFAAGWYKKLAISFPDRFLGDYALARRNCSIFAAALGRHSKALEYSTESLGCYKELADKHPDQFSPDYAEQLCNHASRLEQFGNLQRALEFDSEAVKQIARFFVAEPRAFISQTDKIYSNYVWRCRRSGIEPDAALCAPLDEALARFNVGRQPSSPPGTIRREYRDP